MGVCDVQGEGLEISSEKIYGIGVYEFLANYKWGFAMYRVCDFLLHRATLMFVLGGYEEITGLVTIFVTINKRQEEA